MAIVSLDATKRRKQNDDYNEKWMRDGGRTLELTPPCNCLPFRVTVPGLRGAVWTSLVQCPDCSAVFMTRRTYYVIECGGVVK